LQIPVLFFSQSLHRILPKFRAHHLNTARLFGHQERTIVPDSD
jgi:hypothetical protein